jgi:hypothetical protein
MAAATVTITVPEDGVPSYDVQGEIGVAELVGVLEIVKASVLAEACQPCEANSGE